VALHVTTNDGAAKRSDTGRLEELVRDVGATWQVRSGEDVAATIVAAAVEQQTTQIILGTSKLSRWQSMTRGSVIQQILRLAADAGIDVHVIARQTRVNGHPSDEGDD